MSKLIELQNEREVRIENQGVEKGREHSTMSMETRTELGKYLKFKVFTWITGILITFFGSICFVMWGEIGKAHTEIGTVNGELTAYKNTVFKEISDIKQSTTATRIDVEWIKNSLKTMQSNLKH